MDLTALELHQRQISRQYVREVAKLIREGRFTEAKNVSMRFTGILGLWELQQGNMKENALKDGSETSRSSWKGNQTIC
jgi:hypothetical protein